MALKKKKGRNIKINEETLFCRNKKEFLASEVDGEAVIMNTSNGTYWGLNGTSNDIWKVTEEPMNLENIVSKLMEIYDVDKETCTKETLGVLTSMSSRNILIVKE